MYIIEASNAAKPTEPRTVPTIKPVLLLSLRTAAKVEFSVVVVIEVVV